MITSKKMETITCPTLNKMSQADKARSIITDFSAGKIMFLQEPFQPFSQTQIEIKYWEKTEKENNSPRYSVALSAIHTSYPFHWDF